jgi:GH15 family glucan-1,4-alpha-glucosidase
MRLEELALIGNCQYAAHVAATGEVVWCCMPRLDSPPVFARLLDEQGGGGFKVGPASGEKGVQRYLDNTNVLETVFSDVDGSFRVIDFAPRFEHHERFFRPTQLHRIVEPITGTPRIRVTCDPVLGWTRGVPTRLQSSNHISFEGFDVPVRLTTDLPLSYLDGTAFSLSERRHLVFSWGERVEESLPETCGRFLASTVATGGAG